MIISKESAIGHEFGYESSNWLERTTTFNIGIIENHMTFPHTVHSKIAKRYCVDVKTWKSIIANQVSQFYKKHWKLLYKW